MLTSPAAQLVSRWTSALKVGGLKPAQDTSRSNRIFAGSDGYPAAICVVDFVLPYALSTSCCHRQDATIPLRNSTEFLENVATSI